MFENIEKKVNQIIETQQVDLIRIYHKILECIDLTSLNEQDTEESIHELCRLAKNIRFNKNKNAAASVCVYPKFAEQVREELENTGILVSCAAGNFPSGEGSIQVKLDEVQYALEKGAQEIDYVIYKPYISLRKYDELFKEIRSVKQLCKDIRLKIILETGEIKTIGEIYKASKTAIEAGADFIKTSTGRIPIGATPISAFVMLTAIKEYSEKSGKQIGFKASGGISEPEQAVQYYLLASSLFDENQVNPETFRIGASRLINKLTDVLH